MYHFNCYNNPRWRSSYLPAMTRLNFVNTLDIHRIASNAKQSRLTLSLRYIVSPLWFPNTYSAY